MGLGELARRIHCLYPTRRSTSLLWQAQSVGIFAAGEITLRDAYCNIFDFLGLRFAFCFRAYLFYHIRAVLSSRFFTFQVVFYGFFKFLGFLFFVGCNTPVGFAWLPGVLVGVGCSDSSISSLIQSSVSSVQRALLSSVWCMTSCHTWYSRYTPLS